MAGGNRGPDGPPNPTPAGEPLRERRGDCERLAAAAARGPLQVVAFNTKGYSSTHLAMGFANVRAGTQERR